MKPAPRKMSAGRRLSRTVTVWRGRPPLNVVVTYLASHASDHAAGLAFNAFLSMFPLVLDIALVGLFPQSDEIKGAVEKVLVVAFPPSEQAGILKSFQHGGPAAGTLAFVSLLALLWSGTNLFASMDLLGVFGRSGGTTNQAPPTPCPFVSPAAVSLMK